MAELHIDSDWKKQAQAEKKKLAEQEQQARKTATPVGVVPGAATAGPAAAPAGGRSTRGERQPQRMPQASFASLVQSIVTQVMVYMGEVGVRGSQPIVDLDMAKYNLDMLGVLEEKTRNNLTEEEKQLLDSVLYEMRMRFVSLASRYAELP